MKSINEGRRIHKDKCCENPTYQEIKMVLDDAGYEMGKTYIIEGKYYPRERSKEQMFRGRFKVQLKQSDGELLKENFPSRDSIMVHLGEKIPQLKHRVNPPKGAEGGQPMPVKEIKEVRRRRRERSKFLCNFCQMIYNNVMHFSCHHNLVELFFKYFYLNC